MYVFFDTKTTGVPKDYKASPMQVNNWPRIIQLAWAVFDEHGNKISEFCSLVKPNGWTVPAEKFWIDNGFTQEMSIAAGVDIEHILKLFIKELNKAELLIAHNMDFDFPITAAEMIRAKIKAEKKINKYCTMKVATDICRIPGPRGFKWPKLEELHMYLFNTGFDGAHDALNDVMAFAKCFFELRKRELKYADL